MQHSVSKNNHVDMSEKMNRFITGLLVVLFFTVGIACSQRLSATCDCTAFPLGDTVVLQLHHSAQVYQCCQEKFNIMAAQIEDSRCPRHVQCVWAGTAWLKLDVENAGKQLALELNKPDTIYIRRNQYVFTFASLSPYPDSTYPAPGVYEAVLKITRK